MIIAQLWANAVSYCDWMLDSDTERIELCSNDNNESEKEESKNEKDNKVAVALYAAGYDLPRLITAALHSQDLPPIHHPEISTPPPKSINVSLA